MNLKDKIERHNELENLNFRSDQEDEELIQLKEEIKMILDEQIRDMSKEIDRPQPKVFDTPKPIKIKPDNIQKYTNAQLAEKYIRDHPEESKPNMPMPEKKKKLTIFEYIMKRRAEKREKEKATPEMIAQLRLEDQKALLEARIAINKKKANENKPKRLAFLHNIMPEKIFRDESSSNGFNGKIFTEKSGRNYRADKKAILSDHSDKDYSILTGKKKDFKL